VGPDAIPLARVVGEALGGLVRRVHEEHGVRFHLGKKPAAVDAKCVRLESGEVLPADLVVAAIGVRPDVTLAERAGLELDRGIVVDAELRTSAPGVWAAGDVARWPDARTGRSIRAEHWVVAGRLGSLAARNVLGAGVRCDVVPFFWSAHYDLTINYVGHAEAWDRVDVAGDLEGRDAAIAFRQAGRTLAIATVGRDRAALEAEAAMEAGDERALAGLVPAGR
jgi:3-phenylpropionate/trans-cinnamate dioxygenase ferredoxin reductase subunit